ncbi:unnamed protein product, partial [Hymenolepis diminuta]
MEPDSTTKNLRRHTIQFPSPVMPRYPLEETQPPLPGEHHQNIDVCGQIQAKQVQGYVQDKTKQELSGEGRKSPTEGGKEESSGRSSLSSRIPRQITQPELGSWKMGGLQREAPGNVVGEGEFQWVPLTSVPEAMAKFKITDVRELSLDLGQEAANTQPSTMSSPLPTNTKELIQPPRHSPNLQINITADYLQDLSSNGLSKVGLQSPPEGYNVPESCWENLPHCSTGEPLPQLDLPAYIPSMSHQPVARFTVKDPNLLAPPEFMTPYSSSFPRRSSDGAADMPTLHRPYPLFGGSYPEQANYRTDCHSEANSPQSTYPTQLSVLPTETHMMCGSNELTTLEHIEAEPQGATPTQHSRPPIAHQDTLPVISAQKRFSLPLRQAPSMLEHPTSEKEVRKNYVCCCDQ